MATGFRISLVMVSLAAALAPLFARNAPKTSWGRLSSVLTVLSSGRALVYAYYMLRARAGSFPTHGRWQVQSLYGTGRCDRSACANRAFPAKGCCCWISATLQAMARLTIKRREEVAAAPRVVGIDNAGAK
ncbi:MAG: hypothetical protein ACLVB5_06470 [Christensenellales bacterium]